MLELDDLNVEMDGFAMEEDLNGDGVADVIFVDLDGDGTADAVAYDADGDGTMESVLAGFDTDGDEVADTFALLTDTDGDQKIDSLDFFRADEQEWEAPVSYEEDASDEGGEEVPFREVGEDEKRVDRIDPGPSDLEQDLAGTDMLRI